jgi:hypothetical protein
MFFQNAWGAVIPERDAAHTKNVLEQRKVEGCPTLPYRGAGWMRNP